MAWTDEQLAYVYDRTGGCCEYCGKRLSWKNYGTTGRGGWHVDHSVSRFNGGTDYLRNLFPACWSCNLDKGTRNGKSYRATMARHEHGPTGTDWETIIGWGLVGLVAWAAFSKPKVKPAPPPAWPAIPWEGRRWP